MEPQHREEQLRQLVERCSATVTSPDHAVRVTVGPGGAVTGLELTRRALHHSGQSLGQLVVAVIEQAVAEAEEVMAADISTLADAQVDVSALLRGRLPDLPQVESDPPLDESLSALSAEAAATLRRIRAEADRQLVAYRELQSQVTSMVTTVATPDGGVQVTVRGLSAVVAVMIADAALQTRMNVLAGTILATIQAGYAQAARRLAAQTQAAAGSRLDLVGMVDSHRPTGADSGPGEDRR